MYPANSRGLEARHCMVAARRAKYLLYESAVTR